MTPGPAPTLTLFKGPAHPHSGSKLENRLFLLPHAAAGVSIMSCLNFLYGLLSTSIDEDIQELFWVTVYQGKAVILRL